MVWTTPFDKEEEDKILGRCVPAQQLRSAAKTTKLNYLCELNVRSKACMVRLSGIACIIGTASNNPEKLEAMIEGGMNIACLNFEHGSLNYYEEVIENIKLASCNYNKKIGMTCPLAVAVVTKGPIIRTGFPIGGHLVEMNVTKDEVIMLSGDIDYIINEGKKQCVYLDYENLHNEIQKGNRIFLNDGNIILICIDIENSVIFCRVIKGGNITSRQRVHLPDKPIDLPALNKRNTDILQFAIKHQVDMIFASRIGSGASVREIRENLGSKGEGILVLSQIENQQGLQNIDEIIEASDGIIVARRDLCSIINDEKLFLAQKSIISKCNAFGKPVVCATHMLESMIKKPKPTRAESCDIANAVLDGVDCVLLNHETSRGDYPVTSIRRAADICKQAEAAFWQKQLLIDLCKNISAPVIAVTAISIAAVRISLQLSASAIIVVSSSMKSAQLLTKYKPKCPVIAVTRNAGRARQAHLFRGILPLVYKQQRASNWNKDLDLRTHYGINFGRKKGFIKPGDAVVIITSLVQGSGFADKMRILYVTKQITHEIECLCY